MWSVGSTLMTLVAVDVFETDIKHCWCVRISSLSNYLFNRSPRSKYAVCMYVRKNLCVCIKWISGQIYKTFERRSYRILVLLLCCPYSGIAIFWNRGLYKYPNTYPKSGGDFRTATLSSPSNSKKNRFCSQFDIKLFTWFMIQMKSAAEMGWIIK